MKCVTCNGEITNSQHFIRDMKGGPHHAFCPSGASEASRAAMSASTTGSASAAAELSETKCVSESDKAQRPESKKAGDETGVDNSVVQLPVSDSPGCESLLVCPFCRKTSEDKDAHTQQQAVIATTYMPAGACVVQCNWCGLSGPIQDTIDAAIQAWKTLSVRAGDMSRKPGDAGSAAPASGGS